MHLLLLNGISSTCQLLGGWNHAHVHILLVGSLNLLLLLLEQFDLLLNRKLFHSRRREHAHQRRQLRGTSSMSNVKSTACRTGNTTLRWLILLMLHDDGTCTSSAMELGVVLCAIQMIVGE
jgi:hypothetical protein